MKRFRVLIVLGIILGMAISSSAEEIKDPKGRLEEEFRWLREEAMVVTVATKTQMTMDEAPSIVSVITEEQIKNSGAKSLDEVLRQVVGFNLHTMTTYPDTLIGIRGWSAGMNSSVKMMINGHSAENPLNMNAGIAIAFPVDLIRKIEIIRGPGSAIYGNAAMNGVINIITKDAKNSSSISAGYGSFDTYRGTGQLSYSKNNFSLFLFADHIAGDGDPQMIGKDLASLSFPPGFSLAPGYSNEDFRSDAFFTKLSYKDVYLTGFLKNSRRESPVGISNALTDENKIMDPFGFIETGYEGSLSRNIRLSAKAYFDYTSQDITYETLDQKTSAFFGFPKDQGIIGLPESESEKIGAEAMMTFDLPNSVEMVIGVLSEYLRTYDVKSASNANVIGRLMVLDGIPYTPMQYLGAIRDISGSYNFLDEDKAERTVYAGYVQSTWNISEAFPCLKKIGKNLMLTAGVRYDDYDDVGNALSPRLGLVYAPNERFFFKLLYGEAFRAPSFSELYYMNNPAIIGNPNLEPETIKTAEILAGVNLTERITATLDFFHIRKEDSIRIYKNIYTNFGELESQGVEGEIRASFDKHRYGYFNVTFQKVKDVTHEMITDIGGSVRVQEDFDFGGYPQVVANLGVNSDISRYVNANVSVSYVGSMERSDKMQFTSAQTDLDGTLEKTDQRNAVGSYAPVNFSLIFHNFDFAKGWEFQITGYNIFNADQRDPDISGQVPDDLPRWGRNFLGKITYTF